MTYPMVDENREPAAYAVPKTRFDPEPAGRLAPANMPKLDAALRFALGIVY